MSAKITKQDEKSVTIEITIALEGSMLAREQAIQSGVNEVGKVATQEALKQFDTDGSPIQIGAMKLTSRGEFPKVYQSPYGEIEVIRHVYQSSKGGRTYRPLEEGARIILTATPRFAKIVSYKYGDLGATRVSEDIEETLGRKISRFFVQQVGEAVGSGIAAKEESWKYAAPEIEEKVETVSVGLDGTCLLMCEEGWRETMVGTVALYNKAGERQHTTYIAATPEYGKATFYERLTREIAQARQEYPRAVFLGLADGAASNWEYLKQHTDEQILDFYHATEYLTEVGEAIFPRRNQEKQAWQEDRCHRLKHQVGAAARLISEMEGFLKGQLSQVGRKKIQAALTYFKNHKSKMRYAQQVKKNHPIGSGVTEAACKVIVKQRLCNSGMKWKERGAAVVLSIRSLTYSTGRWQQFWKKVDQYGFPVAA